MTKAAYSPLDLTGLGKRRIVCLTLDLEQDFGDLLAEPSYEGLSHIDTLVGLLRKRNLPLTCFCQGRLLESQPEVVENLGALEVEFGVHAYSHPGPREINHESEVKSGKEAFLRFFGGEPEGYRSPSGIVSERLFSLLPAYGFKYDSSIFPSYRPGYFTGLNWSTVPCVMDNGLVEFPLTVFPGILRIPLSLSYIKLLGSPYFRFLKMSRLPDLIIFNFHMHDLSVLSSVDRIQWHRLPFYYRAVFKRIYRREGLRLLESLVELFASKGYEFSKLGVIYNLLRVNQ